MSAPQAPFRSADLTAYVQSLREQRATLAAELARIERDIRATRPWSWGRFVVGMAVIPGILFVASLFGMLVFRFRS